MQFRPVFDQRQPGLVVGYEHDDIGSDPSEESDLEELMAEHGDLEGVLGAILETETE